MDSLMVAEQELCYVQIVEMPAGVMVPSAALRKALAAAAAVGGISLGIDGSELSVRASFCSSSLCPHT